MYIKCIQNVYHISKNFCIHFLYKIRRTIAAKFCIKCIQKFVEMWDTFCIQTFYIYFVYISSDLQKVYIIKLCMQFVYKIHTECIYK